MISCVWCAILVLSLISVGRSFRFESKLRFAKLQDRWRSKYGATILGELHTSQLTDSVVPELSTSVEEVVQSSHTVNDKIAKYMGYAIGLGAMSLYIPIIANMVTTKDSSGLSVLTWVFSVFGSMLAISYPIKKGFPISTYIEMISGLVQGVLILGLVCLYRNQGVQYLLGMVPALSLFTAFVMYDKVSDRFLKALQVVAIIVCTYSNVPQIVLTFQRGSASWSGITALLSTAGCLIRIFTTLQLTKDKLTLLGYSLGLTTNSILLAQAVYFHFVKK